MGGAGVTVTTATIGGQRHLGCEAKQTQTGGAVTRARLLAVLSAAPGWPGPAGPWQGTEQDAQVDSCPPLMRHERGHCPPGEDLVTGA